MRIGRALGIGIAALLVIVALAVWLLVRSLDTVVARAIEHVGSAATGTRVSVEGVAIDLREATGSIRGLRVANPEGFSDEPAFTLREIAIGLDPGSLRAEPVVVSHVRVDEPTVRLEVDAAGATNLGRIRDHVQTGAGPEAEPTPSPADGEPTRLRIGELAFARGTIHADAPGMEEEHVALPSFTLRDLGGAEGDSAAGIARQVVLELTARAVAAAGRSRLEQRLQEEVEQELGEEAGEALKDLLRRAR